MTDPDSSYEQAMEEIDAFSGELYAAADPQAAVTPDIGEVAPLFHDLAGIRERYKDPELIARGGMKEIYRAYDRRATREVALAKPVPSLGEDSYDAFLREAHITARLDHPGIVKLFDMGIDDDGRPFFTMELKKGRSLREVLRDARQGGTPPLRQRLEILLRVCEAITYAHSRRVLHLDLKPENIQVGDFGEVHVCDWGMGVVVRPPADEIRRTDALLDPDLYGPLLLHSRGTRGYMAPEQCKPDQEKSVEMDVYALGCLLQEMVLLEPPEGESIPDEISDDALRSIICKARNPLPEKRYRSMDAFSRDLSRYLSGYSTSVEGAGFLREAGLFYRRNRMPCRLVGGLLILVIALTTVFIEQLRRSRGQAVDARQVAEHSQTQAQTALRNYLAEREESDRRLREQAALAVISAAELTKPNTIDDAVLPEMVLHTMKQLDAVIALDPPPESPVWFQKFWLLFMNQDFEGALQLQGKDLSMVEDLLPLAAKYAPLKNDTAFLPAAELGRLFSEMVVGSEMKSARRPLIERMLILDVTRDRTDIDRAIILREALAAMNPEQGEMIWKYDPELRTIILGGSRFRTLTAHHTSKFSLLRYLDPQILDLRGSGVRDLSEINGLRLHKLDLRETPVTDLQALDQMPSLRQLRVAPGQFSRQQLSAVPAWLQVVEE